MKITFILEAFKRGGKERRCLQLVQGLNQQGYNEIQLIIVNDGIDYPEIYETSANVVIIDKKSKNLSFIQAYNSIKSQLDLFKPDIVHAWGEASMMYVTLIKLTRKFVYICGNVADCNRPMWYSLKNLINKFSYIFADAVVGNSREGLKAYSTPKKKSHCIYNGFNESRFHCVENLNVENLKEELGIQTEYIVSMFARVDYYKDYDSFISLARKVLAERDDVTFLAVGGGLYYETYKKIPLHDENLHFIGFRSDVEKLMAITDISVLFSNYKFHKEGVSNSILESMAFGTPVIATNDGGSPEIIEDKINGYLVDDNDVAIASYLICNLLDNPDLLDMISANASKTVEDKFLLSQMVRNYLNLYKQLLSRKR